MDVTDKAKIYKVELFKIMPAIVDSLQSEMPENTESNAYNPLENLRFSLLVFIMRSYASRADFLF